MLVASPSSSRDVRKIVTNHAYGLTKEKLVVAYWEAAAEKYDFKMIDHMAEHVPLQYQ